jgi:uridine kinase
MFSHHTPEVHSFESPAGPIMGDWFFDSSKMPMGPDGYLNWETPAGVNFELLAKQIQCAKEILETCDVVPKSLKIKRHGGGSQPITNLPEKKLDIQPILLFVEGFLLFTNPEIVSMCDERIWIEVDEDTALERRYKREMRGWGDQKEEFSHWFRTEVWTHYLENRDTQKSNAEPLTIEVLGARERDEIFDEVKDQLRAVLLDKYGVPFLASCVNNQFRAQRKTYG